MKLWRYQYPTAKTEQVTLNTNRSYWLQVVKGNVKVNGIELTTSDALGIRQEDLLEIYAQNNVEFLLFDLV